MHHHKPPVSLPPSPKESKNWWQRLSTGEKTSSIIGVLTLMAAILVIPEVRYFLHLEKRPEEHTAQPAPTPHEEPPPQQGEPPRESKPEEPAPGRPHIRYVPLPNAAPLKTPRTLVTSMPKEGTEVQTVSIGGEKIPIMNQEDVEKLLAHKVDPDFTYKWNPSSGHVDLFIAIRKDGTVQNVQVVSGDKHVAEEAKEAVKQWRFKPFMKDGVEVAVQTVIQVDPKTPEKQRQ
jgi:protein TonB